jgi:hypothetical protein
MPELSLRHLGSCAGLQKNRGVHVTTMSFET